jgi:hypothetical protein
MVRALSNDLREFVVSAVQSGETSPTSDYCALSRRRTCRAERGLGDVTRDEVPLAVPCLYSNCTNAPQRVLARCGRVKRSSTKMRDSQARATVMA